MRIKLDESKIANGVVTALLVIAGVHTACAFYDKFKGKMTQ